MMIEVLDVARKEFDEAFVDYATKSTALGEAFRHAVKAQVLRIKENPDEWMLIRPGIRKCLGHRFPYDVIYQKIGEKITDSRGVRPGLGAPADDDPDPARLSPPRRRRKYRVRFEGLTPTQLASPQESSNGATSCSGTSACRTAYNNTRPRCFTRARWAT